MLNNRTSGGDGAALKSAVSQKTAANHTRLLSTWNVNAPKDRIFKVTVILIQVVTQGSWPACWTEHSFPLGVAALWRWCRGAERLRQGEDLRSKVRTQTKDYKQFLVKDELLNVLGFAYLVVSVTTTQGCHWHTNELAQVFSIELYSWVRGGP